MGRGALEQNQILSFLGLELKIVFLLQAIVFHCDLNLLTPQCSEHCKTVCTISTPSFTGRSFSASQLLAASGLSYVGSWQHMWAPEMFHFLKILMSFPASTLSGILVYSLIPSMVSLKGDWVLLSTIRKSSTMFLFLTLIGNVFRVLNLVFVIYEQQGVSSLYDLGWYVPKSYVSWLTLCNHLIIIIY